MMRGLWVVITAYTLVLPASANFSATATVFNKPELLSIVAASGKQLADTGRSCGGAQYRIWRW